MTRETPNAAGPIETLLIANRGEIAVRIARTARARGQWVVMVFTDADRGALHTRAGDQALRVDDYLDGPGLVAAAKGLAGTVAVHPGYGFLAERADFAQQVIDAGLVWVGPPPAAIAVMGDKAAARRKVAERGVPVAEGYDGDSQDDASLQVEAALVGFPIMVKAAAGGGGKGMQVVRGPQDLAAALARARRLARSAFGDDRLVLERFISPARHVEVQVLADHHGTCLHLFERECSLQRRHQKVIEEAPSPALSAQQRAALCHDAVEAARAVGYVNAGTVEFLLGPDGRHHFLEMNTRLQVEHPVTEAITGLDLVGLQLFVAEGGRLPVDQDQVRVDGWAIEARLYAEDAAAGWMPSSGQLAAWWAPPGVRVDSGVGTGSQVGTRYDPLLAKIIAHGSDREQARRRLVSGLRRVVALGPTTSRGALIALLEDPRFVAGDLSTQMLDDWAPPVAEADWIALCAVLAAEQLQRRAQRPMPEVPAGWRNNRWRDAELTLEVGDQQHRLRWREQAPGHLQIYRAPPDEVVPVEPEQRSDVYVRALPGGVEIEVDGLMQAVAVVAQGDLRLVQRPQGDLRVRVLPAFVVPGREAPVGGLTAPMTGTVVQVKVVPGDRVAAGQTMVVLEAMKMEQAVKAPQGGTVAQVAVVAGQQVEAGTVLVVLEATAEESADGD